MPSVTYEFHRRRIQEAVHKSLKTKSPHEVRLHVEFYANFWNTLRENLAAVFEDGIQHFDIPPE